MQLEKPNKNQKISLIKKLSNNYCKIISRKEIRKHKIIDWGDNGLGDRFCNKYFNYTSIYKKNYKTYSDYNEILNIPLINNFQNDYDNVPGIIGILIHSIKKENTNRPISANIKKEICKNNCVVCGSTSEIVCDHKNDLYDDPRVLSIKTQILNDFQPLCNHCNLQKRQVCKNEKLTGIIYSAKNLPQFNSFNIDFPWEKTKIKTESYWYDPVEFCRKINIYMLMLPFLNNIKGLTVKH